MIAFIFGILQVKSEHLLFLPLFVITFSLSNNMYWCFSPVEIRAFIVITFSLNDSIYCCFSPGEIRAFIGGVCNVSTGRCGHRQTHLAGNEKIRVQGRRQFQVVSCVSHLITTFIQVTLYFTETIQPLQRGDRRQNLWSTDISFDSLKSIPTL